MTYETPNQVLNQQVKFDQASTGIKAPLGEALLQPISPSTHTEQPGHQGGEVGDEDRCGSHETAKDHEDSVAIQAQQLGGRERDIVGNSRFVVMPRVC